MKKINAEKFKSLLKQQTKTDEFLLNQSGATAIEYALIAAGIGMVIAATFYTLGSTVSGLYTSVNAIM